jgi:hypothetical protein
MTFPQNSLEGLIIGGLLEQLHPRHAAIQDVKNHSTRSNSRRAWHQRNLAPSYPSCQYRTCPSSVAYASVAYRTCPASVASLLSLPSTKLPILSISDLPRFCRPYRTCPASVALSRFCRALLVNIGPVRLLSRGPVPLLSLLSACPASVSRTCPASVSTRGAGKSPAIAFLPG